MHLGNINNNIYIFYVVPKVGYNILFTWKKTALSLLSSPRSMTLFKVEERPPNCEWFTVLEKNFPGFTIGAESPRDEIWKVHPKPYYFYMDDPPTLADVPNGASILCVWDKLHEDKKCTLIQCLLWLIFWL